MTFESDAVAQERLGAVRHRIEEACARSGREPGDVSLIGVSKRQPAERIAPVVRAGITHLGESYVQELRDKRPLVEALLEPEQVAGLHWHMVGGLQRNKVRTVLPLVEVVDSLDRASLATELDRRAAAAGRVVDACIQVNLSREAQKSGVAPEDLKELLASCTELASLRVVGLMTVPAASDDPERSRPEFARLRELRDTLQETLGGEDLRHLSMGMSGDFEIAIEEGATQVRVGTALFGPRET
jgi:hypothetical protein